jgi:aminoglycoside phosphotransferase family enzyme/predicted kinase
MPNSFLIQNLQSSKAFNHPTLQLGLIETHVSWVILTGKYAYKIKKPVDFGFLDFSTLEKRKHYCEEELRLGQQFAPEIYLAVVPITGTIEQPQINGSTGPILEYAIKMCEFSQDSLLSSLLKQGKLTETLIEQLGKLIAEFHQKTPLAAKKSHFGLPQEVHAPTKQNFEQIIPLLSNLPDIEQVKRLQLWANEQFSKHQTLLAQRKEQGFIRDCHGDLHLANIILYQGKLVLFDRLEFNEDLRWTDVIADLAFLAMDLAEKKQTPLANQLINTYLQFTNDYQGLNLLAYYLSYRAVVRAKIALFRSEQANLTDKEKIDIGNDYHNFINLAEFYTHPKKPCLIITHGLSGSGKSTVAKHIVSQCAAIQISSDRIRKQLFGLSLHEDSNSAPYSGIYTAQASEKTYNELARLAKIIIQAGFTALIDATFLLHAQRVKFYNLAKHLNVPYYILDCQTDELEIKQRIKKRSSLGEHISEANLTILDYQKKLLEPLIKSEQKHVLVIDGKLNSLSLALEKICPPNN